ncbi:MAG: hypothetical protein RLZZ282_120, partial [Verrucomicrobiota bacterium]
MFFAIFTTTRLTSASSVRLLDAPTNHHFPNRLMKTRLLLTAFALTGFASAATVSYTQYSTS